MATYLLTQDVLNVAVSCFANYDTPANPVTINLLTWLGSPKHRIRNEALRLEPDKAKRDAIKATLPAITPSAVFTYRQQASMVAGSHTRLIQFDIDPKDNPHIRNYADLKAQISKLPFVAYCALSASGKGYWGLVVIADPERHGQHFDALRRVFAHYRINIDTKPRNVASLRGYSYDPAPYLPQRVMLFELYDEPPKAKPRPFDITTDADTDRLRVEVCIQEVLRRGAYLGDSYGEWYEVGCSLANGFGESGRDYYHQVSQHYPGYESARTDKQFTACLGAHSQASLGTFFHLCQQQGIEWKDLLAYEPLERTPELKTTSETSSRPAYKTHKSDSEPTERIATIVTVEVATQQVVSTLEEWKLGVVLKPTEDQIERETEPEVLGDYPTDWDTPAPKLFTPPTTRLAHPGAPLTFDTVEQLRRIQVCVIAPGAEETTPPVLTTSPNRDEFARVLGLVPDDLTLYQLRSQLAP